jgi:hydrogenase expression/formation protein HypC
MEVSMCLAIPAQIVEMDGSRARVSLQGNVREADLSLVDDPQVGEWVLVHAGFAIEKLTEAVAQETLDLLMQTQEAADVKG